MRAPSHLLIISLALTATLSASVVRAADTGAAASARALLAELEKDSTQAKVDSAIAAVEKLGAPAVPGIVAYLKRTRKSSDAGRRDVLKAIQAQVPDAKGRFATPGRAKESDEQKADDFDWLADLVKLPASTARGEVIGDVAAIRALATIEDPTAGAAVLDLAFSDDGIIYRDECGRYLRKMSPYSLPALAASSQHKRKDPSLARYATYQLERLDRQDAHKALGSIESDALKVALLKAYADSGYREAVYAVLDHVNHPSVPVRTAARAAWMEYVAGKPPRPAPKRKLAETGGKLSDEKQPLWLDHRELAGIELRRVLKKELGEEPAKSATLVDMSKQLFAFYDSARSDAVGRDFERGVSAANGKKWAEAARLFDRVLARNPAFEKRDAMAETYFQLGKKLQEEEKYAEAALAFSKAEATDPKGTRAKEALAAHHFNRGKALAATSEDASEDLARAREIDPENGGAGGGGRKHWLLYGGLAWLAGGVLLLIFGLLRRRRR